MSLAANTNNSCSRPQYQGYSGLKMNAVALDLGLLRTDHKKLADRVTEVESKLAVYPAALEAHSKVMAKEKEVKFLMGKLDDAEGCSRRNNICLVGMPEQVEGQSAELDVEEWLSTVSESPPDRWLWARRQGL